MTDEELRSALDGLFAYDMGSTDSGIHDEALRARCIDILKEHEADGDTAWVARLVRDTYLTDAALEQGYGLADLFQFVEWLEDRMDCSLR